MKQTNLKLIDGRAHKPSPPEPERESYWQYAWMFAISGVVWIVIGYWIWQYVNSIAHG
jgi:hypothetical protein